MKMRRPYRIAAIALGALTALGIGIVWVFRSPASYDPAKVTPRLLALRQPFKEVRPSYVDDGGSVYVTIVDADDVYLRAWISARIGEPRPYERLFLGGRGQKEEQYSEVPAPRHSLLMLQQVLHEYRNRDPVGADLALVCLRGRLADYARILRHKLAGRM